MTTKPKPNDQGAPLPPLTKREYFTIQIFTAMAASKSGIGYTTAVENAVKSADLLIEQLNK